MHTSEGSEVATPPPPQGRQLPRRRRRYAVARTATNRPRAGKEAVTAVIGKAYRPEEWPNRPVIALPRLISQVYCWVSSGQNGAT